MGKVNMVNRISGTKHAKLSRLTWSSLGCFGVAVILAGPLTACVSNESSALAAAPPVTEAARDLPSTDIVAARREITTYPASAKTFQMMDAYFPVAKVSAAPGVPLAETNGNFPKKFTIGGQEVDLESALVASDTNALLVLKDGAIVYETYLNGSDANTRFIGWSMSKSVTSLLFGIALSEGDIHSIEDTVETYLPDLKGTAFEGVTLRNLLEMRGGSSYREQGGNGVESHVDQLVAQSIFENKAHFTDISDTDIVRLNEAGVAFNYSTLTTSILGRVIESATGVTLAEYTSEKLWKPAGMQDDAYWLLDGEPGWGDEWAGGGFNATARDFARLGLMVLQGGEINDRQVVPAEWITQSSQHTHGGPVIPNTPRGYGYQWWTFLGTDTFEAVGVHGQFTSIDPVTDTVIVKLSYWPVRGSGKHAVETHMLLSAIRDAISE